MKLKDVLVKQELDDYMYEETKYMTTTIETIHMENICIKELKEALEKGDEKWLTEQPFHQDPEKRNKIKEVLMLKKICSWIIGVILTVLVLLIGILLFGISGRRTIT